MDHITALCACSFYSLFIPFYLFIYLFIYLLKLFQPQIVLMLFLFFERFQPQCSY